LHCRALAILSAIWALTAPGTPSAAAQEPAPPPVASSFFRERRTELMRRFEHGVVLITANPAAEGFLPFHQNNEFFYLSGIDEAGIAMLLFPKTGKDLLLVQPFNRFTATWDGERLVPGEETAKQTGFAEVGNVRQLDKLLEEHLAAGEDGKRPTLWTVGAPRRDRGGGRGSSLDDRPSRAQAIRSKLAERFPDLEIKDVTRTLNEMRGIKTTEEIEQVRRSTDVACQAIAEAMKSTEPGMYEYQVAAVARYVMTRLGAGHDAYEAIVGGGPNGCVLHYRAGKRQLRADDLIVMDYAATINNYASDVTRTFPASGTFSPAQKKLVEDVYAIQQQLIAAVKPGATLGELSRMCSELLRARGYRSDHGPCHHVGLDVHDQGDGTLAPGMLITVEPGAYLRDAGMGCRIEDVVLVTETGCVNLSGHLPARPDDIEKLMAGKGIAQQPVGLPAQDNATPRK
jgi:Xaa-Pro aminopeptidase